MHHKYPKTALYVINLVDASGSLKRNIENVKNYCVDIENILKNKIMQFDLKFGSILCMDPMYSIVIQMLFIII